MQKENKKSKGDLLYLVKLVAVTALAFIAALTFRRSAGILAMTPVAFLLCGVSAFIGVKPMLKLIIFGVTVFSVNTVEQSDMRVTVTFTALCLLACLMLEGAVQVIKKGKKYGFALLSLFTVVLVILSIIFVGNPIKALSAEKVIDEYVAGIYPEEKSEVLGNISFGSVYYDHFEKTYSVDAVSDRFPTESSRVSTDGDKLTDSFLPIMESKLQEPYVLEITAFLRERFPNDSFEVACTGFAKLPNESVLTADVDTLRDSLYFEITLGGIQTADAMLEGVDEYITAIDRADISYAGITFKSGIGQWFRRSVTVDGTRPEFIDAYTLERVHTATDGLFHRYASRFFKVN